MGSESLNWRSAESELPPADCNTDPVRSQTYGAPQVPSSSVGSSKVESIAGHEEYVAYLHASKDNIDGIWSFDLSI